MTRRGEMSLSDRLSNVVPSRSNRGCETCRWLNALPDSDRRSFDEWIDNGNSMTQLWEICASMEVDPLPVSFTGMRNHIKHHKAFNES